MKSPYPKIGDWQYCRRCTNDRKVIATGQEYQITCDSCPLSHKYGDNQDAAERAASRHVMKRPTHVISVWQSGKILTKIANDQRQGELPYGSVLRRRTEIAKKNQQILRDLLDKKSGDAV